MLDTASASNPDSDSWARKPVVSPDRAASSTTPTASPFEPAPHPATTSITASRAQIRPLVRTLRLPRSRTAAIAGQGSCPGSTEPQSFGQRDGSLRDLDQLEPFVSALDDLLRDFAEAGHVHLLLQLRLHRAPLDGDERSLEGSDRRAHRSRPTDYPRLVERPARRVVLLP